MAADTNHHTVRAPLAPHTISAQRVIEHLQASIHGLTLDEIKNRQAQYGVNTLPRSKPTSIIAIFFRQFLSPLVYILCLAALISLLISEWSDATFITLVLLINAIIGTAQEYSAQHNAEALSALVTTYTHVVREGEAFEINAESLVPGDIILLESGSKVPADIRLITTQGLAIDESLLTGESAPVNKDETNISAAESALGERTNMAFAGTHVTYGRATGIVTATASATELGRLADAILGTKKTESPLQLRMENLVFRIGIAVAIAAIIVATITLARDLPMHEVFILVVALAVGAIPEGLPVAITVALAIGMNRMAKRNVIVRRLIAVESLGSCTFIASDKTGTLTLNELTARYINLPGSALFELTGQGVIPDGKVKLIKGKATPAHSEQLKNVALAAALCNEGFLGQRAGNWAQHGDTVDVALLVMAYKLGITQPEAGSHYATIAQIPFEPEHRFAATLHQHANDTFNTIFVKGATERVIKMCSHMLTHDGSTTLDPHCVESEMIQLASDGHRVLALAMGQTNRDENDFAEAHLSGLTLIGLVAMVDPLREESRSALIACRSAGIETAMITGDHPATALSIARELNLASETSDVISGAQLKQIAPSDHATIDAITQQHRVFARIEPQQKLQLVESLKRNGHFVAVTGDGANDGPAMQAAHVGVAMGKKGTDVARESADIILSDDNFNSIVAGVEEGRVIYNNIRKVIFLLLSTGAAEVVLFMLALISGLPLPLLAVQLLWLNLVTNGIQDIALVFEPKEGDEMNRPPRAPKEPIFNRLMIERIAVSGLLIGSLAFTTFYFLLQNGFPIDEARNATLLLMVLFENVHVFNSRSETRSALTHNPLHNPLLLFGTLAAQLLHIGAMYTPLMQEVLHIQPISFENWLKLLGVALILLLVMEAHKMLYKHRTS